MSQFNQDFTERNYNFNFERYLARGWEIFRQDIGGFIGFIILNIAMSIFISLLPESQERLATILYNLCSPVFTAGYYIVAIRIAKNKSTTFTDFFAGFSRFIPIVLVSSISFVLIFIGTIFLVIPGIYLAVSYFFALLFVIEHLFVVLLTVV